MQTFVGKTKCIVGYMKVANDEIVLYLKTIAPGLTTVHTGNVFILNVLSIGTY